MSEARKCDRCHGFYDFKPSVRNYITIGVRTFIGLSGKSYDLCPNCIELLDKWLKDPDNYNSNDLVRNINDTNSADRSNGATEKELELVSKLNDANIYIAQLKSELGHTMTKEEIEFMKGIHNFTDEDISEAAKFVETKSSNEYSCPGNIGGKLYKCVDCLHFTCEPNPFNPNDHKGIYLCNLKNVYISGNCSRPKVSDMTPKDFCNLGCNFDKETTEKPDYKDPCKSCHNGKCEQCVYGYISEEEKKKRWLERNKKEEVK